MARAAQAREEHAFAAEDHALDPTGGDHVEIDRRGIGRDAAGIDMELLAGGKLALDHGAAHLDEHPAVAVELLHDEALAAEQAGHHLALEMRCRSETPRAAARKLSFWQISCRP
jgi:hypothetical protein